MRITIVGANGLIGSYLSKYLAQRGHEITQVSRGLIESPFRQLRWNPDVGEIDPAAIDGQEVVINLAGKNIASDRWNERVKKEIVRSRVLSTELVAKAVAQAATAPRLLINASATGYYGNRPASEIINEESQSGTGFMSECCELWERATAAAEKSGVRVAKLRTGVVLSRKGGALERMVPFFKLGLGGRIGAGTQVMSWISLEETGPIVEHIIRDQTLRGGINLTAPNPASYSEFADALGRVLHRPTMFPVPAFVLRVALGEMADELLLGGANVVPRKLIESGYRFEFPELLPSLSSLLS
jgi:uncharacterized protein (TIGR01777 family)